MALPLEEAAQCLGPQGLGISEGLGFINNDEGVFVGFLPEMPSCPAQLNIIGQFFIRNAIQVKLMDIGKSRPGPVAQRRRRNQKRSLPAIFNRLPDQLSGDKRLPQPHSIGNQDAIVFFRNSLGAEDPIILERRQPDPRSGRGFLIEFVLVPLPENSQEYKIGREFLVSLRV